MPVAPPAQVFKGELRLRGAGVPLIKSAALFPVSTQPSDLRNTAFVLLGAGAGVPSEQFAPLPYPTKSMSAVPDGHAPVSAVVWLTSATLPAVAARLMLPVASGVGSCVVPPVPAAS